MSENMVSSMWLPIILAGSAGVLVLLVCVLIEVIFPDGELMHLGDALVDLVSWGRLSKPLADAYWEHALECAREGRERKTIDEFAATREPLAESRDMRHTE